MTWVSERLPTTGGWGFVLPFWEGKRDHLTWSNHRTSHLSWEVPATRSHKERESQVAFRNNRALTTQLYSSRTWSTCYFPGCFLAAAAAGQPSWQDCCAPSPSDDHKDIGSDQVWKESFLLSISISEVAKGGGGVLTSLLWQHHGSHLAGHYLLC